MNPLFCISWCQLTSLSGFMTDLLLMVPSLPNAPPSRLMKLRTGQWTMHYFCIICWLRYLLATTVLFGSTVIIIFTEINDLRNDWLSQFHLIIFLYMIISTVIIESSYSLHYQTHIYYLAYYLPQLYWVWTLKTLSSNWRLLLFSHWVN